MTPTDRRSRCRIALAYAAFVGVLLVPLAATQIGQVSPAARGDAGAVEAADVLTPAQWEQVDRAVDRALAWLAGGQRPDGSFPTLATGQPGVTSLAVMAFLSRGHLPGQGPYGTQIDRAIDFVLATQRGNGLFSHVKPPPAYANNNAAHTGLYNHAIAGLMLGEVYGMTSGQQHEQIRAALVKAIAFSRKHQIERKRNRVDIGGWRYLGVMGPWDADLSVTIWHVMFLRSARNAGFEVDTQYIDDALGYVRRCYDPQRRGFMYALSSNGRRISRGTTGAGILSLSLAGEHDSDIAKQAGQWLLTKPFDRYNASITHGDRYHYGAYYCSQAMFQLGGEYWAGFYPPLTRALLTNQNADGSWQRESEGSGDSQFGNAYTTALMVVALTPPYQLLPIYQR